MHNVSIAQRHDTSYVYVPETPPRAGADSATADPAFGRIARSSLHNPAGLPALARKLYDFGHRRSKFLPSGLFGEPAWYILLDLYASEAEGRAISVTSASVASGAPSTTGLRVIRVLEDKGLVCKGKADSDRRRSDVQLTLAGRNAIEQILRELQPLLAVLTKAAAC